MAEATAPASSANLGAGFDTLALALELRCTVTAELSVDWRVDHVGAHSPDSLAQDAVLAAAQRAVGIERPLHLTVSSEIPVARGLGSSAAAYAAGALAAWRATGIEPVPRRVFDLVSSLEGHADNAAAAVFGGLQAVTISGDAYPLVLHPNLLPVLAVPTAVLLTSDARAALPDSVSRYVAVRSLQRAVALVQGLRTADRALLAAAAGDEIHEEPRTGLNPQAAELITAARDAGALFACWSGAGPSVLALSGAAQRPEIALSLASVLDNRGSVLTPAIAANGVE
ncbi:MAG: homoserine kinase [Acidimicrobiia bacterium]|nr:homoserine kinase [Acidimicrobiia bacterium]MDH3397412.1 homoserine kinase [Acidimicrobiia bacterium]